MTCCSGSSWAPAESPLSDQAADLLLAALDGDESLSAQLTGQVQARPAAPAVATPARPAGAYLRSLTVSGFRGIGPPATLTVSPRPGLTLVVGRNGSGKSSFAEALEVLLTGNLRRWEKLPVVWRQGWRSVHQPDQATITAEFVVEGAGPAMAQRTWPAGTDFAASTVAVQVPGEKQAGIERLGWTAALTDYRPFLSHSELEAFFGSSSGLYELLVSVLGLEDLAAAATRLAQARRVRETALNEVKKRLPAVLARLEAADDERAPACHRALAGRTWDLAAARSAATSFPVADEAGESGRLRRLAQLTAPAEADVLQITNALRAAAAELDAVAGSAAGRARALAGLLTAALRHHTAHGDGDCPVCGQPGALTAQWRQATEDEVARLGQEASAAESAERAAADARHRVADLLSPPPGALLEATVLPGIDTSPARAAWQRWASPPEAWTAAGAAGMRAMADQLNQELALLTRELHDLSALAAAEMARRDDSWAPVAAEVTMWCADADRRVTAGAGRHDQGRRPVAEGRHRRYPERTPGPARRAGACHLGDAPPGEQRGPRRDPAGRVGDPAARRARRERRRRSGSALGVMSQGEVNALALSVFLPRATLPASPFRFLVIDDPVQAMDPAKVDGLARVLERTADGRQVVVFTHDNRLADAVRQLSIPATILEVTRRPGSAVQVRPSLDPVEQALRDAGALAADDSVPAEVAARVVPGLCRTAVEAAFTEAVWRRELRGGRGHADIEDALEAARVRLNLLAALALTGDAAKGGEVLPRLRAWSRRCADTYQALNKGAHVTHGGDLRLLIGDAKDLVARIRAASR